MTSFKPRLTISSSFTMSAILNDSLTTGAEISEAFLFFFSLDRARLFLYWVQRCVVSFSSVFASLLCCYNGKIIGPGTNIQSESMRFYRKIYTIFFLTLLYSSAASIDIGSFQMHNFLPQELSRVYEFKSRTHFCGN